VENREIRVKVISWNSYLVEGRGIILTYREFLNMLERLVVENMLDEIVIKVKKYDMSLHLRSGE